MDPIRNVIIIGSGPSGYTAALYAARAQLNPLVIEGVQSGGSLMTTTDVENFPGFSQGVTGPDLMDNMRKQAEHFGAELLTSDVTRVSLTGEPKQVWVGQTEYRARAVIIATGSAHRSLNVPGESALVGHGVSSCATCDGFFFRGKQIAVVGGGDSAMEEATFLTRFATTVNVIHRGDELRASKIMVDRATANPKITIRRNCVVTEILSSDGRVSGVSLQDTLTGTQDSLEVSGVFVAIGYDPRSTLFVDQVEVDSDGYIKVDSPSTRTNLAGVFAAGDVVDHHYRQAITAAGLGCAAALDAERYLAGLAQRTRAVGVQGWEDTHG